jgi:hypothetical protein
VILAARGLLLLLAASAVIAACLVLRGHSPRGGLYTCAMHPEITAPAPGECPICRMALEPARPRATASDPAHRFDAAPAPAAAAERFTVPPLGHDRLFTDVMFVRPRPVSRAISAPAWADSPEVIVASLYHDELALLVAGDEGVFTANAGAGGRQVRFDPAAPTAWDAATSTVRLQVVSPGPAAGTVGRVVFAARTRPMLAVPASALLQGPGGPFVLVASLDRHTLTRRPVEIGRVLFGYAPVLSGLQSGERVAVMETFFIDAERRLGGQTRPAAEAAP